MNTAAFSAVFQHLRYILEPYALQFVIDKDGPTSYSLNTAFRMKNKKPLFFASTTIGVAYVSFHLMPAYVFPELLTNLSPRLRKRMQGKSCFNFTTIDESLFTELAGLTDVGCARYRAQKWI